MDHPVLLVVMRFVHIVSAVLAVGGMAFILLCLTPATRLLDEGLRETVLKLAHHRFLRVVWASIAGLIISGAWNWIVAADAYRAMGPKGNAVIGTKVLLALVVFGLVAARSFGLVGASNPRRVLMINIHLAAVVILLGSLLRVWRMGEGG